MNGVEQVNLTEIIQSSDRLFIGSDIPADYLSDNQPQAHHLHALAYPVNREEVVALMHYAKEKQLVVIPSGANSGLAHATQAHEGELLVDFSRMNRILDFDLDTLTLSVEPGITIGEVQKYVQKRGFFYPPDPASKHSTIGGNVSTNAGGMRAVKYGTTRDYVRRMEVVLISGEVLELGSIAIKNSSGYNLKQLFIGSEGTLGLTTRIDLKVIPLPMINQSVIAAFPSLTAACEAVISIMRAGLDITACEFFERDAISLSENMLETPFPSQAGQAYLLMTFDGSATEAITSEITRLQEVIEHHQPNEILLLDEHDTQTAWKLRDSILTAVVELSENEPLDLSVPTNKIATLFAYTKEVEAKSGLRFVSFGHAGDGNIHSCILRGELSDAEWAEKRHHILTELYQYVHDIGGLPSAEHGIGLTKKPYFDQVFDSSYRHYLRQIKLTFDPENRLNPGKLV